MTRPADFRRIALRAITIAGGLAILVLLTGKLEGVRPPLPEGLADTDLDMHGSRVKGYALGMEGLLADWYYMRALQYIGDKIIAQGDASINIEDLSDLNPRLLYPLLDNATDLDPHFIAAYEYGALILPAIDPEKAIALAAKGIANNPDEWRLYRQLGYVYWRLERFDEAASTYERGAAIGGSSPFLKMMAASIRTGGRDRSTFRAVYTEMLASSTDEKVREMCERRLQEIDLAEEREAIDGVLEEFRTRNGRCANSFSEIGAMLMKVNLPGDRSFRIDSLNRLADPSGEPYRLDKQTCRVAV